MKKITFTALFTSVFGFGFSQVTIESTIENQHIIDLSNKMIAEVNLLNSGTLSEQEKQIFELKVKSDAADLAQTLAKYEEGKSVREVTDKIEFRFVVDANGNIRETTTGLDVEDFKVNSNGNLVDIQNNNTTNIALNELNIDVREMTTGMDVEYRTANGDMVIEHSETTIGSDKVSSTDLIIDVREMTTGLDVEFVTKENNLGQAVSNVAQTLNSSNLGSENFVQLVQELVKVNQEAQAVDVLAKSVGAVPKSVLTAKKSGSTLDLKAGGTMTETAPKIDLNP